MRRSLAVCGVALLLAACTGGSGGEPLLDVQLVAEDRLALEFSGCESEPEVTVTETDDRVQVRLDGPNGGCEPVHDVEVPLDAPLGDRVVIDATTGREFDLATG